MKISEMIEELKVAREEFGDLECLIEISVGDGDTDIMPVEELSVAERGEYGESVLFVI